MPCASLNSHAQFVHMSKGPAWCDSYALLQYKYWEKNTRPKQSDCIIHLSLDLQSLVKKTICYGLHSIQATICLDLLILDYAYYA